MAVVEMRSKSNGNGQAEYFTALDLQDVRLRQSQQARHIIRLLLKTIHTHAGCISEVDYPAEFGVIETAYQLVGKQQSPNLSKLTEKQRQIALFIREYKATHNGIAPTLDEICNGTNAGKTTIQYTLPVLESIGLICLVRDSKNRVTTRGIQLAGESYVPPVWEV